MKTQRNEINEIQILKIVPRVLLFFCMSIFLLSGTFASSPNNLLTDEGTKITINPEFKFKRLSNGTVEMYRIKDKDQKKYRFTDFNADILLSAYRRLSLDQMISILSRKYDLSTEECRRQLKHSVNILEDWGIVLKNGNLVSH